MNSTNSLAFNPANPGIWAAPCYAYNPNLVPDKDLAKMGYNRKTMLAISVIQELRDTVVERGLSLFVLVDGRHRAGKSRLVYLLACIISRDFEKNPEHFMVKDAEELLTLIAEIDAKKIKNPVIIVDEAGSALNRADWQEKVQNAVIKTLNVVGYLHPTIFFCAPLRNFILKGIRDMAHVYIKVSRNSKKYASAQVYRMSYNSLYNKQYSSKFRINFFGQPIKVNSINVSLPPKNLDARYSEIEMARKPKTLQDIHTEAHQMQVEKKRVAPDFDGMVEEVRKDLKAYTAHSSHPERIKINAFAVRAKFGCSLINAQQVKYLVENKVNLK